MASYGSAEPEAHLLTLEASLAEYWEQVADASGNPAAAANFVLNDLLRLRNECGDDVDAFPIPAGRLAELIRLVDSGTVSATVARRDLFPELYREGGEPAELLRRHGLEQVSDEAALREIVERVIADHPDQLQQYRGGKQGLLGFFVGRAMRASGGRANPRMLDALLRELLDG
jgi:aspartyl-tRNA(Asn)/glutamyl-tRNA(Gln) amidotransferase subunit B